MLIVICRVLTVFRVPRLNLGNIVDDDGGAVDYTIAMDSPLVAAAAGYGYCCLNYYILNYIHSVACIGI